MPWHKVQDHSECPSDRPWAVVKDDDGEVEGCHANEEEADAQIAALNAQEDGDEAETAEQGEAFTVVICVEGVETGEGPWSRLLGEDGGYWRNPPLPAMAQTENPEFGGHAGAFLAGSVERIERDGRRIMGYGHFSVEEEGQEAARLVDQQVLRFASVDIGDAEIEYEDRVVTEDGWPVETLARFESYEIMGVTFTPFPALDECVVWLDRNDAPEELAMPLPEPPEPVTEPEVVEDEGGGMLILASGISPDGSMELPPSEWFDEPADLGPWTPAITVTSEGRAYGYVAPWGVCHIAMPGCTTAPRSANGRYAYFRTGATRARCTSCPGETDLVEVATGVLTLGTSHAGKRLSAADTAWHYEHTGAAVADVAVGENEHGIWFSGAVRPGATDEELRQLRGSSASGDWRRIGGDMELVAALCVNVPGFPMPRPQAHVHVASGVQTALVAAATPVTERDPWRAEAMRRLRELEVEVGRLRSIADPLRPNAIEAIEADLLRAT